MSNPIVPNGHCMNRESTGSAAAFFSTLLYGSIILFSLFVVSLFSYALFHSMAEIFSVVVAYGIFMVTWNARRIIDNNYLLFLGIAYLFIGTIDLVHTLAHPSMDVIRHSDINLAVQLWIAARYLEGISLFLAPVLMRRSLRPGVVSAVYFPILISVMLSLFYWHTFPACFTEAAGETLFKRGSEYVIAFTLLSSLPLLYRQRASFDKSVFRYLFAYSVVVAGTNLFGYGLYNVGAHFFKIVSFYFIYKAIIETGLVQPYNLLFATLKEREASLREERDRAQKYLNVAPVITVIVDKNGKVALVNRKGCELLGYDETEIVGQNWFDTFVPERSKERLRESFLRGMTGEWELVEYDESPIRIRSGDERTIGWYRTILRDEDGNPTGTLRSGEDITDRKNVEKELRRHREELENLILERTIELTSANAKMRREMDERLETNRRLADSEREYRILSQEFNVLLDAIPDSILLLSRDLKVLWANRGAASGLNDDSNHMNLNGAHCYDVLEDSSTPCDKCHALECFRSGEAVRAEFSSRKGRVWDVNAFPIKGDNGETEKVIMISRDITERINLQAETMRAGHLASLGELSAGVAHEINNPINGIINYAQMIANKSANGDKEKAIAERIIKEGNRITNIVRSLLSFARDRHEEKGPVAIHDILDDTLALVGMQLNRNGIDLRIDVSRDLPAVIGNPQQIQQVFLNLINNAQYALNQRYKESHENKILEITGSRITYQSRPYIRITFFDMGSGIPSNLLDKVAHPFFSTKPKGQGTGLGLSISHGIIIDHGGKMVFESVTGECTRVIVELPEATKTSSPGVSNHQDALNE